MNGPMQWVTAAVGVAALGAGWAFVQGAWRRTFPGASPDPDVLAARRGCRGGCDCHEECDREPARARPAGEENP